MNECLELGPDILTNLHGLFLRFRNNVIAAAGDIRKMYYMIRVTKQDEFMQLFVWKCKNESQLRQYAMTRIIMGSKPSPAISCIAVAETARLCDFETKYPAAFEALTFNSYVDNTFITGQDIDTVRANIAETEIVAAKGGFYYKEWVVSGQQVGEQTISVNLPNQIAVDEERALGVHWDVEKDIIMVKVDVTKPPKKSNRKNRFSVILSPVGGVEIKPKLTLRTALSIHAKP